MNSFIQSCVRGTIKGLLRLIGGVITVLALIIGAIWLASIQPKSTNPVTTDYSGGLTQRAGTAPISQAEFQTDIARWYQVQTSRFIEPDLLHVTFGPGESEQQKKCQGIANMYALRNGMSYFRVECWAGNARLGQGTVMHGVLADP